MIFRLLIWIQSNKVTSIPFPVEVIWLKRTSVTIKETATAAVPIIPETVFPKLFPKKTLIKNLYQYGFDQSRI